MKGLPTGIHQASRRSSFRPGLAILMCAALAPLLMGAACKKKSTQDPNNAEIIDAADRAGGSGSGAATGPVDTTPLPGVDVSKLSAPNKDLFYKLLGSLGSPCGKGHSLRVSVTNDSSCKRAPFAVRYVLEMLQDEATEDILRKLYTDKYTEAPAVTVDISQAPTHGSADAPIKLVEYFDYGCPVCQEFKPELDKVLAEHGGDIYIAYLMYPITSKHPNSHSAAQAALAAFAEGKFQEMHDLLYTKAQAHAREDVMGYAKQLGLDPTKFAADYDAVSAHVDADQKAGEAIGVDSTPTLFFNGHPYKGPMMAKYLNLWIDEELAVNR